MKLHRVHHAAVALSLALVACHGGRATSSQAGPVLAPVAAMAGAAGDTAAFGLSLVSLSYSPDLVSYELRRPSYVTILSVSQSAVEAIIPGANAPSRIEMAGPHLAGLTRFRDSASLSAVPAVNSRIGPLLDGDARLADVQEYNRCIAQAEAMNRRDEQASRRIIGRDSAGAPIYGPPTVAPAERNYGTRCAQRRVLPRPTGAEGPPSVAKQAGRYLLLFASDTPVSHHQVLELAISESDPLLITRTIGSRLFGPRAAIWSGLYRAW